MARLIAELITVVRSYVGNRNGGPGNTVFIEGVGLGKAGKNAEMYGPVGMISNPPKDSRGVFIPITRNYGAVVGLRNYKVCVTLNPGESLLFSTAEDGASFKARIECDNEGKIRICNETKTLKSILTTLIGHVRDLVTINCVSGSPVTLNPTSIANLNADITELAALLKD